MLKIESNTKKNNASCSHFSSSERRNLNTEVMINNPLKNINKKIRTRIWSSFGFVSKTYLLEESLKYSEEQERIFNEMIVETDAKDKKAKREAYEKALYASYKGIGAMDFINTVLK